MTSYLFCYLVRQARLLYDVHLGASIFEWNALTPTHSLHVESPKAQDDCACSVKGTSTQGALFPEQVVVFDLEYGQPAASTTLPTLRPAFRDLLGCFGHADAGKRVLESGVDLLYTSHQVNATLLSIENFPLHKVSVESAKVFLCGQRCNCGQERAHQFGDYLARCAVCTCHHPFRLICHLQQCCHESCGAAYRTELCRCAPALVYEQRADSCSSMRRTGACQYGGARLIS